MQTKLLYAQPEQCGVSAEGIADFLEQVKAKRLNLHSFMLLRYGCIVAEAHYGPYERETLHPIYSISKSITSAAAGFAVAEGRVSLEDAVVRYFPDKVSIEVHPFTAAMKVKDLLTMSTVHPKSVNKTSEDWVKTFLTTAPSHAPGTIFGYDTLGTHTLCAIIQKVTGVTVHQYLQSRLFDAIDMGKLEWDSCPLNINKGGGGIRCTTEGLARFGQLYLQGGVWNGRQVLPDGWTEVSTARHIDNSNAKISLDGNKGYGYQFWRCRNNAYCAFGRGGQFIVVMPEREAVFVTTADTQMHTGGHQAILDTMWETIYPTMHVQGCPISDTISQVNLT